MEKRPIFQKTPGARMQLAERPRLNREEAETIALRALGFLAEDEDRIGAFMGETGISPDDMRDSAASWAAVTPSGRANSGCAMPAAHSDSRCASSLLCFCVG